jgi:hypothetical protein
MFSGRLGKFHAETKITKGWIIVFLHFYNVPFLGVPTIVSGGGNYGSQEILSWGGHRISIHGNCIAR